VTRHLALERALLPLSMTRGKWMNSILAVGLP
jgi:hypothetical protein